MDIHNSLIDSAAHAQSTAVCSEDSPVIGIRLPSKADTPMRIGSTSVTRAYVYGRRAHLLELVNDLADDDSLFHDVSCSVLLMGPHEALKVVDVVSAPARYHNLGCRQLVWQIPDTREFLSVVNDFSVRRASDLDRAQAVGGGSGHIVSQLPAGGGGGPEHPKFALHGEPQYKPSDCRGIGGMCVSRDGEVSVSVECKNAEVTFMSSGNFSISVNDGEGFGLSVAR